MFENQISEANDGGLFEWPSEENLSEIMTNPKVSLINLDIWSKSKTNETIHTL